KVGAFDLGGPVTAKITSSKPYKVKKLADKIKSKFKLDSGKLYMGTDPTSPAIGDVRVEYKVIAPKELSIIAKQVGNGFEAKKMSNGDLLEVTVGKASAEKMFAAAESSNAMMTWMLRIGGFVFMFIGFTLLFKPFTVIADKIPLVGGLLESGITLFAGMLAFGISFVTIAAGWIVSRPLVGIPLCIVGVGALAGMVVLAMRMKGSSSSASA
ncbi:MAG: TMEM43 family protein, partial [Myxococcota bacterium]